MWFAVTAYPSDRRKKEKNKEYFSREGEVIVSADSRPELEQKLSETKKKFPLEFKKYMKAGIKIIEAENTISAKRKANRTNIYFDEKGQYHIL